MFFFWERAGSSLHINHGDEFFDGLVEDLGDGLALVLVVEGGLVVALAFAFGAGEVEVGEELHLDLFEAVAEAAFATASAGVEGEEAGLEGGGFGFGGEGEELANGFEGSEVDGGGGFGGFSEGSLVDELDTCLLYTSDAADE